MLGVLWSGRPPDAKLVELLRGCGVRVADGPGSSVVAEIVVAAARAVPGEGRRNGVPWIWFATGAVSSGDAGAAVASGAYDVIDARGAGAAALLAQRIAELASVEPPVPATDRFVAASDAARAVLREVAQAARTSMPVLLTGETGTGKEVAARLLHEWSSRRTRSFVPINCAAIPNDLIEAELFGYAKGAFTGSVRAYEGQLTGAAGGTVFLDEVDDTPLPFQVKLLRVLEDRVVSVAMIATFIALCNVKAGNITQAMQQAQANSVDAWAYFQAKGTKLNIAESARDALVTQREISGSSMSAETRALIDKKIAEYETKIRVYEREKGEIKQSAEGFQKEYERLNVRDDQFDMAEALTSVAIALLGITALTRKRRLLYVGWTFAGFGIALGIAGFARLNLHFEFLARLLG